MNSALQILSDVKAVGGTVALMPPDGLRVSAPRALVEQVRAHKQDILLVLLTTAPIRPPFDLEAFDERAAIIEDNGVSREWADGFATLDAMPRPPTYILERWQQIISDGGLFLDRWGRQAAALGWRAVDMFGVNPNAPEIAYCDMGLVPLLQGRPVIAITGTTARIDCGNRITQTFTRQTMGDGAVAIWKLVAVHGAVR